MRRVQIVVNEYWDSEDEGGCSTSIEVPEFLAREFCLSDREEVMLYKLARTCLALSVRKIGQSIEVNEDES